MSIKDQDDLENLNDDTNLNDDDISDTENSDVNSDNDVFDMSDEEFLQAQENGELDPPQKDEDDTDTSDTNSEDDNQDEDGNSDKEEDSTDNDDSRSSGSTDEDQDNDNSEKASEKTSPSPVQKKSKKRHAQDRSLSAEEQEALDRNIADQTKDLTDEDYKNAYKDLLKPIWARGHNFTPRNIDEVKTLMSQGVDYLYKTQQLAKNRKQIELLQREGITDEDLTFLIDLRKGDPEAVKKFFSDTKINPYDVDTSEAPNYQPKTQMLDDATLALRDSVNNLIALPDGKACYDELVSTLDVDSQNHFLKEPQLLQTFYDHQHINVGNNKSLYTIIKEEIDHAKALGQLPQNMTFLDAYRTVGDRLLQQQGQAANQPSSSRANPSYHTAPNVHQRLGSVQNRANVNDRVRSAGVTPKTKSTRSKQTVNPFDLPDDEFLKQFDGRL